MSMKITVIGAGSVGATVAYTLVLKGLANEVTLVDINKDKAEGEAMDIHQGTPLLKEAMNVYSGDYVDAVGSDIVVITSGVPRKPGQTRLDLTQTNVNIIRDVAPQIYRVCPNATYIMVSNPVDILTYVFAKVTGIPEGRIIGSGTLLDTARLRARISQYLSVSQKNIHAYVFGEHGETSFIPWSIAHVSAIKIGDYMNSLKLRGSKFKPLDYEEIDQYMRSSGSTIIKHKGCTNYAIAMTVASIVEALRGGVNTAAVLSTMLHGEYGISDVCLSLPVLLARHEVRGYILPQLTDDEMQKLNASANALKEVIAQLDI